MVRELAWEFFLCVLGAAAIFAIGSALGAYGPGLGIASLALSPFARGLLGLAFELAARPFRRWRERRAQM